MLVSQIAKENFITDSQSYKELSPIMKEAVNDVFKLVEKSQDDILKRFDKSVENW